MTFGNLLERRARRRRLRGGRERETDKESGWAISRASESERGAAHSLAISPTGDLISRGRSGILSRYRLVESPRPFLSRSLPLRRCCFFLYVRGFSLSLSPFRPLLAHYSMLYLALFYLLYLCPTLYTLRYPSDSAILLLLLPYFFLTFLLSLSLSLPLPLSMPSVRICLALLFHSALACLRRS